MKAVTFQGIKNVKVKEVPDPKIEKKDDIIGHEPMGVVEETGPEVTKLKKGDRVIVPFNVSCGECFYCKHDLT